MPFLPVLLQIWPAPHELVNSCNLDHKYWSLLESEYCECRLYIPHCLHGLHTTHAMHLWLLRAGEGHVANTLEYFKHVRLRRSSCALLAR
jgi:hypothetical protein